MFAAMKGNLRLEATASRSEAIALGVEAIAISFLLLLGWRPSIFSASFRQKRDGKRRRKGSSTRQAVVGVSVSLHFWGSW